MLSVRALLSFNASGGHEQHDTLKDEGQVVMDYLAGLKGQRKPFCQIFLQ
jgi:hypothetical protein